MSFGMFILTTIAIILLLVVIGELIGCVGALLLGPLIRNLKEIKNA